MRGYNIRGMSVLSSTKWDLSVLWDVVHIVTTVLKRLNDTQDMLVIKFLSPFRVLTVTKVSKKCN